MGLFHLSETAESAQFWNKWPYLILFPGILVNVLYILEICDSEATSGKTFLGFPIRYHLWIMYVVIPFFWIAVIATDHLIAPPVYNQKTGWEHGYGGLFLPFNVACYYLLALLIAIFGAPDSRGEREDAVACVRMAINMQARMRELRKKWWNEGILFPFAIRCGIHTGMANVGNYGSEGFMEYSAIGLNTNLASRLEHVCEPGEIYVSHSTWALIKEVIPSMEVGTVDVKGFHYPVKTYKILQDRAEPVT